MNVNRPNEKGLQKFGQNMLVAPFPVASKSDKDWTDVNKFYLIN